MRSAGSENVEPADESVNCGVSFNDGYLRVVSGVCGATVNRQHGNTENSVYYILLFVYGVYSAIIQNRAFSEKYGGEGICLRDSG